MPLAVGIAGLALSAYSMVKQNSAAKQSEQLARDTAERNANLDITGAKQLEMDTDANIIQARRDAEVYTSRQHASYAASGVLADSGSPLAVQASTVGRLQQRIQQEHSDANQRESQMYNAAKAGVAYGDAQARAINTENTAAELKGGVNMLSTAYGMYRSGTFGSAGNTTPTGTYNTSTASYSPGSGQALLSGGSFKY